MKGPRHIVWMEQGCWKLCIQRGGEQTVEYFFVGKHGGKRGALKAALKRRREVLVSAPAPTPMKGMKTKRNKTGFVGVRLCDGVDRRKANVHRYLSYVAFWTGPDGRACTIGFAHNKYGQRKAFALACIAREKEIRDRAKIEEEFNQRKLAKIRAGERLEAS